MPLYSQNIDSKIQQSLPTRNLLQSYSYWDQFHQYAGAFNSLVVLSTTSNVKPNGSQGPNRPNTSIATLAQLKYDSSSNGFVPVIDSNNNPLSFNALNQFYPWSYWSSYNQRHSSKWMARALINQDLASLEKAVSVIEYAFKFQDYQSNPFVSNIQSADPNISISYTMKNDGRLPSATVVYTHQDSGHTLTQTLCSGSDWTTADHMSFFLADAQTSYNLAIQSDWFTNDTSTEIYRIRLFKLHNQIKVALNWFSTPSANSPTQTQSQFLEQQDSINPNRILKQALMYYGWGTYFNNEAWKQRGRQLTYHSLQLQCNSYTDAIKSISGIITRSEYSSQPYIAYARSLDYLKQAPLGWGWFSESGGSDSSYQNTNLMFLLGLYPLIPIDKEPDFKRDIWTAIVRGLRFEMQLLQSDYTFALTDNTRVSPTGETFAGQLKTVDYLEATRVLQLYQSLTNDKYIENLAVSVFRKYTQKTITPVTPLNLYSYGLSKILDGTIDLNNADLRVTLFSTDSRLCGGNPYVPSLSTDTTYNICSSSIANGTSYSLVDSFFDTNTNTLTSSPVFLEAVQSITYLAQLNAIVIHDANTGILLAYGSNLTSLPFGPNGSDMFIDFGTNKVVFSL